jgi:glycosyltransferase involved in cell wall biosynthesis
MVSILIPVYNRESFIEETVQSSIKQTYNDIEIIIVDNKSTDNTWNILKELSKKDIRIKIFQNEINIGPVRNWKRCINEASGEYGKILWSDDLIAPEFIEKTLPYIKNNNDVGFVFTGTEIFIDGADKKSDNYFIGTSGVYDSERYINGVIFESNYPVSPGCALFRLNDLKQNLLVDIPNKIGSDFPMHAIGNDLLVFLLTANQYKSFAFVNEKLSFFRAHDGSISINSSDGKLPLHYAMAKAYFLENNYKEVFIFNRFNAHLFLLLQLFKNNSFGVHSISDFFVTNKNYKISYSEIVKKIFVLRNFKKLITLIKRNIHKT